MGLSVSHGAWYGPFSAFHHWRAKLAEVAGLPPLDLMEGFYVSFSDADQPTLFSGERVPGMPLRKLDSLLPIRWQCLSPDPLNELLSLPECDSEIPSERCAAIAESLENLIPLLPEHENLGSIGKWREKTQDFVAGLRAAAAREEPLTFR